MPVQKISLLKSLKTSVNTLNVGNYNDSYNNALALYIIVWVRQPPSCTYSMRPLIGPVGLGGSSWGCL